MVIPSLDPPTIYQKEALGVVWHKTLRGFSWRRELSWFYGILVPVGGSYQILVFDYELKQRERGKRCRGFESKLFFPRYRERKKLLFALP